VIGPGSPSRQTLWRWHFYAGVLVWPFILVLAASGAFYLFKPQVDRWEERAFHGPPTGDAVAPSAQVRAALAVNPGAAFAYYRLPERPGDAALVHLALPGHGAMRDVFVSPQGRVVGGLDPETRLIAWDRQLHGQLLLGRKGSWLVELVASWTIVLIVSGLWLWWPGGQGVSGILWPRLAARGRALWRDLHAVTGFWVSGLALVLLLTGLPWADAWGSLFKLVREQGGLTRAAQDWTIGGKPADLHAEHDHAAMTHMAGVAPSLAPYAPAANTLDALAAIAAARHIAFPALVIPPGMPAGEGGAGKPGNGWVIRSDAQDRPLRQTLRYDATGARLLAHETFAGKHWIDRVIGYGVAWHEGQLLGWVNQLVGLLTALALWLVAISAFIMWRRRKPGDRLGAPRRAGPVLTGWRVRLALGVLLIWLPLFTASLAAILLLEWAILRRIPRVAGWLGLSA
jgi:uncharacterized iron-regulated membrane protein